MVRASIVVVVGLVGCRDGSTPSVPAPALESAKIEPKPAITPRSTTITPRPSLPIDVPTAPGVSLTVQQTFDQEPIDRFWRANTESKIKQRMPTASDVECHQTLCRITVIGNEHDLATAVDAMESERSLRGIARSILLTAPDRRADGTLALRAYASFDHDP